MPEAIGATSQTCSRPSRFRAAVHRSRPPHLTDRREYGRLHAAPGWYPSCFHWRVGESSTRERNVPPKRARAFWAGGWYRMPEPWLLLAVLVLPLGWVLPLCRFAWVRVISQRGA